MARAALDALLESDDIGVALLRPADWAPITANACYDAIVGRTPAGASQAPPDEVVPRALLEAVVARSRAATVSKVLVRNGTAADGSAFQIYASFSFLPVRHTETEDEVVLVLATDVSDQVHERRIADLFVMLATEASAECDAPATIRRSITHATKLLGADAASIFLLSPDARRLHGALVGWDWTRTSFVADLAEWPNVQRAVQTNHVCFFTAADASRAEEGWFEHRGIAAAICAPMAADGEVLGVLFFDYMTCEVEPAMDLDVAKAVADQCAVLVKRASSRADHL
jgi:GAF domain